ncbi:MAG: hypothetical protein WC308_01170 [archaeon]
MGLVFFFAASQQIFFQTADLDVKKNVEEFAHPVMSVLLGSSGEPSNWEYGSITDVNIFGIVSSKGVVDSRKFEKLAGYLNGPDYSLAKEKLGIARYDFQLSMVDSNGDYFNEAGFINENADYTLIYERVVYYGGRQSVLRGVFSYAK